MDEPSHRPTIVELVLVAAVFVALVLVQLTIVNGLWLVSRPLWFDECLTYLIASDTSFTHSMHALAGAVDTNTPLLYILLRGVSWICPIDDVTLRVFSLACVTLAIVALYAVLCEGYSRGVAIVGALALWAHPLVLAQSFEARFYAPWLAATACFAWAMSSQHRMRNWTLAITAIALCTIHYFGILAMGLMTAAFAIRSKNLRSLRAIAAGPIALAMCLPFLFGQRAALAGETWIGAVDRTMVVRFISDLLPAPLICAIVLAAVWRVARDLAKTQATPTAPRRIAVIALVGLAGIPVVLAMISLIQPVLLARYAIVACLAIAVGIAALLRDVPRVLLIGVSAALMLVSTYELRALSQFQTLATIHLSAIGASVSSADSQPAIFCDALDLVPICHAFPAIAARCKFLDVDNAADKKSRFDRRMIHNIQRFYPLAGRSFQNHGKGPQAGPLNLGNNGGEIISQSITPEEMKQLPAFIFVPSQESPPPAAWFAGAHVTPVNSWVLQVRR